MIYETYNAQETFLIGRMLGEKALPGQLYCLDGDLGAGKTIIAKGFAEGLGIKETVTSPTFNILKEYKGGRLLMNHFDVYRIQDPDELYAVGFEDQFYGDGVTLVEWSELIKEHIPGDAVHITVSRDIQKGENYRKIEIN